MDREVYQNAGNVKSIFDNMVNVICHFNGNHGSHPAERRGEKIQECDKYPGVTCQEHEAVTRPIGSFLGVGGNIGTPMTIVVDPNTKQEYMRKNGKASAKEIQAAMQKAQAAMGPALGAKETAILKKFDDEYAELEDDKVLKKALKDAKTLVKLRKKFENGPEGARDSIDEKLALVEAEGLRRVDATIMMDDKGDAEKELKKIQKDFKDFDAVKDAAKEALESFKE